MMNPDTWLPTKQGAVTVSPQAPAAVLSDDGRQLFAGSFVGAVRRWDLSPWHDARAAEPMPLDKAKQARAKRAASAQLLAEAEPVEFGEHGGWVEALATQGRRLVSADSWGKLCCWDISSAKPALVWRQESAHDGWIRAVEFTSTGLVVSCGRDQTVKLWEAEQGRLVADWRHTQDLMAATWSDAAGLVLGDARGNVLRWSVDRVRKAAETLPSPEQTFDATVLYKYDRIQDVGGVKAIAVDEARKQLAVAGAEPARGATVQGTPTVLFFDLASGELQATRKLGASKDCYVHALQLHPEGFWMAVTCGTPGTGQLLFFNTDDEEPFYVDSKVLNPHSLCFNQRTQLLCMTTTNRGSNGNGRRLNKEGEYEANTTPIELLSLGAISEDQE